MPDMVDRLIEMHAANNRKLTAIIERLTKRNHALEQVVEQGIVLLDTYPTKEADAWLFRAKALLEQERK